MLITDCRDRLIVPSEVRPLSRSGTFFPGASHSANGQRLSFIFCEKKGKLHYSPFNRFEAFIASSFIPNRNQSSDKTQAQWYETSLTHYESNQYGVYHSDCHFVFVMICNSHQRRNRRQRNRS